MMKLHTNEKSQNHKEESYLLIRSDKRKGPEKNQKQRKLISNKQNKWLRARSSASSVISVMNSLKHYNGFFRK